MVFERKDEAIYKDFESLEIGDCFMDGQTLLIKVSYALKTYNSFNLKTNSLCNYSPDYPVKKINCKIVEI